MDSNIYDKFNAWAAIEHFGSESAAIEYLKEHCSDFPVREKLEDSFAAMSDEQYDELLLALSLRLEMKKKGEL